MKKIININLSGRVIPIEDSAYENLQTYIESLRRYFANEEGRDEIINDIESRIAELMSEKVRKGADCISDADVNEIAASMGRPEDFEAEEQEKKQSFTPSQQAVPSDSGTAASEEIKTKRRLYRDTTDKFIGGVCSGIAAYLNVDPAIVRILFAIITFGGFGLGFLAYILLWIILPAKDIEGFKGKRLFRNPDNRMIGGVCGGLAAYFNRSTSTIRLIFLAPIILNILINTLDGFNWRNEFIFFPNIIFGSLTGTFILAYIILWIVLPEAKSPYEKMEMRGEKVDVNTIRQNVQDRAKEFGEEVKSAAQNFSAKAKEFAQTSGKTFATEAAQVARPVANGLGHAIGVLFKVFFLFIAGTIAFGLFVALMAIIFGGVAWWPVNNFLWTSNWQQVYAWGTLILFLGIPLIGFLIWLIRRIIGVKSRNHYLGWTFGGLWTLGWISVSLLIVSITKDVRYYDHSAPVDVPVVAQPKDNRLLVAVAEPALEFTDSYWWIDDNSGGWDISEDSLKMSFVKFSVLPSPDSFFHVAIKKYSAGRSARDVNKRAERIQYRASYLNGVLDLGSGFAIDKESKYRGQMVEVEIRVPAGKKIRFDESVKYKLNPVSIKIKKNRGWRRGRIGINIDEYDSFPWETNTDYIMGIDGELKNADGTPATNYTYRYNDNNDSLRIEQSIEKKKNELKELEERKKEQIQKKQNTPVFKDSVKEESLEYKNNDDINIKGSPIFSLVQFIN
jgi:phage shock protein PspC (stress-responsive transcriptional regulator)/CHASE3 domain sensor protein